MRLLSVIFGVWLLLSLPFGLLVGELLARSPYGKKGSRHADQ